MASFGDTVEGLRSAHLYLPIEKQRASVDVEPTYAPKAGAIDEVCAR
jgi:hypothetical protein